jgi:hypothetical protein
VPETCRELKNRINKAIKSGASSWFSARNIARCTDNKTLNSWRSVCLRDADGRLAAPKIHLLLLSIVLFRGEWLLHIMDHVNRIPDLLSILNQF